MAAFAPWIASAEDGKLPPGLTLHFDFDRVNDHRVPNVEGEVGGGNVRDARFVPVGGSGNALAMRQNDEPTNFVEVKDHPALNSSAFTVAAWVCPRRIDISGAIVCKHDWLDGGNRGFTLRANGIQTVNFTVGAGGWMSVNTKSLLRPNTWIHVAATYRDKTLRMYFNGKLEDSTEVSDEYTPSPYPLRVGHAAFALDRHRKFDGKIDDVMYWGRCLSVDEISAVYEATKDGRPSPITDEDINAMVKQLGADDFQDRVAAQMALVDLGPTVLPLLEKHEGGEDKEVKMRAQKLMKKLSAEK